jgi:hypothetical protein
LWANKLYLVKNWLLFNAIFNQIKDDPHYVIDKLNYIKN